MEMDVLSVTCDTQNVALKCGASNPLRRRFPSDKYFALHCNWIVNSAECGLTGATCNRTLDNCRTNNNAPRFGGFPGLENGGLRFA
jgi:phage-related protein